MFASFPLSPAPSTIDRDSDSEKHYVSTFIKPICAPALNKKVQEEDL